MKPDEQMVLARELQLDVDRLVVPTTMSLLLTDGSGSMERHGNAPVVCMNGHLETLRDPPDKRAQVSMIVTFSGGYQVVVPLSDAKKISPLDETNYRQYFSYQGTLLWRTVKHFLEALNQGYQLLPPDKRKLLKVCVGVISDGEDNLSNPLTLDHPVSEWRYPRRVKEESAISRSLGFELLAYGLGVDGQKLAHDLGFPEDDAHAVTVAATRAGLAQVVHHFSNTTTTLGAIPDWPPKKP